MDTPLHLAFKKKNLSMAAELIQIFNANQTIRNSAGFPAIQYILAPVVGENIEARTNEIFNGFQHLLLNDAGQKLDLAVLNNEGYPLITVAAMTKHERMLEILLGPRFINRLSIYHLQQTRNIIDQDQSILAAKRDK